MDGTQKIFPESGDQARGGWILVTSRHVCKSKAELSLYLII